MHVEFKKEVVRTDIKVPPVHSLPFILPSSELLLCIAFHYLDFHSFGELLLCRSNSLSSIPLASYFWVDHFTLHPSTRLVSHFRAVHLTLYPTIRLASYLWAVHLTLHPSIRLVSYFRADHLTLHPSIRLVSYFRGIHLTRHPSIRLASYFRADHWTLHPCIPYVSYFCYFRPYIGMESNRLLWIHLRFIWAPIAMY